ncbi:MAG: hypothetical protein ACJAS5_000527 [Lentimonas sp.]
MVLPQLALESVSAPQLDAVQWVQQLQRVSRVQQV